MEARFDLKAELRQQSGSAHAAGVRKLGLIPAIIYGHKEEPVSIAVDTHNFTEAVHHGHRLMDVKVGRKKETVIIKELQYDHLGKNIIHADLMRVDVTETVRVSVPLELKGTAKGTHEGGVVQAHTDHIDVECRVTDIPEKVFISVKDVGVGDHLYVKDIELPPTVKLVTDPQLLIVSCNIIAEAATVEQVVVEEPTVPEVISKGKKEEEAEAELQEEPKEKKEPKEQKEKKG